MERVMLSVNVSSAYAAGAQDESPGVGYRPRLKDGHNELIRVLEMNGAAAAIIAVLLSLDAGKVGPLCEQPEPPS